ncbi:MAG TPA: hypothetical protein EYP56_13205 [Planctomycetaceae bacterium]|nr:hypothetical protein [Planctomycetaceae bacterium]
MGSTTDTEQLARGEGACSACLGDRGRWRLPRSLYLVLGIAAGAALFGICEAVFPIFHAPGELLVPFPPPEVAVAREAALSKARMLNAVAALGTLGLLLGGLLGIGEAAARRFGEGALKRVPVAAVLGVALGGAAGIVGHLLTEGLGAVQALTPLGRTTVVQAVMLGVFGGGVGASVGLVAGGRRSLLSGCAAGVAAGVAAGLLFPVVCSLLMHRVKTEVVIPGGVVGGRREPVALALWIGFVILALSLVIPLARRRKKPSVAAEPSEAPTE